MLLELYRVLFIKLNTVHKRKYELEQLLSWIDMKELKDFSKLFKREAKRWLFDPEVNSRLSIHP